MRYGSTILAGANLPWTLSIGVTFLSLVTFNLGSSARAQDDKVRVPHLPKDTLPNDTLTWPPLGLEIDFEGIAAPDAKWVAVGRKLFFDPILSRDYTVSCASCHRPELAFADDRALSVGIDGQLSERNAPSLLNRVLGEAFMWDGRAATLEQQIVLPIANPIEMDLGLEVAVSRLRESESYASLFETELGGPPNRERLAKALAEFVRSLTYGGTPHDQFREGHITAMTAQEQAGLWIYESRGRCWRCHTGANFSDETFHNTGIGVVDGIARDGRMGHTGDDADRGRFKTPTLRGLGDSAPYMHDGSLATLEEVVEFYRRGGNDNPDLDRKMEPLHLSDRDAANLVAFLKAITSRK
jgi:cytochrome c peroxidase